MPSGAPHRRSLAAHRRLKAETRRILYCFLGLSTFSLTEQVHQHGNPDGGGGEEQANTQVQFPFASAGLNFGNGLAETGTVQGLDFLWAQLLPVTLLLVAQCGDLIVGLTEADSGHGVISTIGIAGSAVPAKANDLTLANLVQRVDRGNATNLGVARQLSGQLADHGVVD